MSISETEWLTYLHDCQYDDNKDFLFWKTPNGEVCVSTAIKRSQILAWIPNHTPVRVVAADGITQKGKVFVPPKTIQQQVEDAILKWYACDKPIRDVDSCVYTIMRICGIEHLWGKNG